MIVHETEKMHLIPEDKLNHSGMLIEEQIFTQESVLKMMVLMVLMVSLVGLMEQQGTISLLLLCGSFLA